MKRGLRGGLRDKLEGVKVCVCGNQLVGDTTAAEKDDGIWFMAQNNLNT